MKYLFQLQFSIHSHLVKVEHFLFLVTKKEPSLKLTFIKFLGRGVMISPARAAGEQRPPPEPTEFPSPGPLVSASGAAPGGWNPRAVLDKLRLRRQEISLAAETVNKVVDHLLRGLKSCDSEFKDVGLLRTGSYYEHVKISAPNEFDIMFKLEVSRIQLEEYRNSGAYYFVKFKRNPKGNPLSPFLEGEILSASKMLLKFRKIIKKEIENIEGKNFDF
uniref:Cyclic GMP-AMP synthase n=1 Tax=Lynx canadensis TaxID=61383 RepID=A0A667H9E1_LYNCA